MSTKSRGALSAARLAQYAREDRCVALRLAGASLATIAATEGYVDRSGARKALLRAMRRAARDAGGEELRLLEEARLDRLFLAVWAKATGDPPDLKAVDRALKNCALRIRLLGLDAPPKVKHSGDPEGAPIRRRDEGPRLDLERLTLDEVRYLRRLHAKGSGHPVPDDDEHAEVPLLERLRAQARGEAAPAADDSPGSRQA